MSSPSLLAPQTSSHPKSTPLTHIALFHRHIPAASTAPTTYSSSSPAPQRGQNHQFHLSRARISNPTFLRLKSPIPLFCGAKIPNPTFLGPKSQIPLSGPILPPAAMPSPIGKRGNYSMTLKIYRSLGPPGPPASSREKSTQFPLYIYIYESGDLDISI